MSAILSANDLNDFISPGVACIKPVESLPKPEDSSNPYEVTTEDKIHASNPAPTSISLTDCLACSGCVTSAEAVLISLQSHAEVLTTLDAGPSLDVRALLTSAHGDRPVSPTDRKLFVASVSPQVRASLAATYDISEEKAGNLIENLLCGPHGLRSGGKYKNGFDYAIDTNRMREASLILAAEEVAQSLKDTTAAARPILTSACPGWICYAEKTHPHILPHLSRLKSPQALSGILLKSVLSKALNIHPSQIWHLAIMPCFDKKLEASRAELTDRGWAPEMTGNDVYGSISSSADPVRDVDCVITSRELLLLAAERSVDLSKLPHTPLPQSFSPTFPDPTIAQYLFPKPRRRPQASSSGTSGGYLSHIFHSQQLLHPQSTLTITPGRNTDMVEYNLVSAAGEPLFKCARFYGFKNITNLVRKLKPPGRGMPGAKRRERLGVRAGGGLDYAYVEVMACPGGCTNGGGQIRVDEALMLQQQQMRSAEQDIDTVMGDGEDDNNVTAPPSLTQREWLRRVDSAYFSTTSSDSESDSGSDHSPGPDSLDQITATHALLDYWSSSTGIPLSKLVYTTFRAVESDVGKTEGMSMDTERVARLAGSIGGGW